jgi:hypothetical protein
MYNRSLRPVVIFVGFFAGLWALLSGISSFRDLSIDKAHEARLAVFDIVLGSLYFGTMAIEIFGIVAAFLQRLPLVRIYAFLSLVAALIITTTEIIRVVIHFVFKDELINECTMLSTGQEIVYRFGLWGPVSSEVLTPEEASIFCNRAWSNDSTNEIIWLFISGFYSFILSSIAFAYYRQLVDPHSAVNSARDFPSTQPLHYNPPYESSSANLPELGYNARYAPPAGPPPDSAHEEEFDHNKLPPGYGVGLGGDVKDTKDSKYDDPDAKDPFTDFDTKRDGV